MGVWREFFIQFYPSVTLTLALALALAQSPTLSHSHSKQGKLLTACTLANLIKPPVSGLQQHSPASSTSRTSGDLGERFSYSLAKFENSAFQVWSAQCQHRAMLTKMHRDNKSTSQTANFTNRLFHEAAFLCNPFIGKGRPMRGKPYA